VYEKHGFVVEGTRQAYALRDSVYVDTNLMAQATVGRDQGSGEIDE
jgi:hypothetical protein